MILWRLFCLFALIFHTSENIRRKCIWIPGLNFLYLSEPDMIKAGVKNMDQCVEAMEDLLVTLNKGDYVMAGVNHNSHGAQVIFSR